MNYMPEQGQVQNFINGELHNCITFMTTFQQILNKYFNRNKIYLFSTNILHEMNGVVLNRTNNQIFDFHSSMIEEVKTYCRNQGFNNIDKIVFFSYVFHRHCYSPMF